MPKISIVVPVYDVEAFLPMCLESIAAQTVPDFECILVDDGSPDGCGAICDEWAARDCRFIVIHQENSGLSAARNSGMKKASGDYFVFCDGDDALHPRLLELALAEQARHPQCLIAWGFTSDRTDWTAENARFSSPTICSYSQKQMLRYFSNRQLFNSACNKLYPRVFLQQHNIWFDVNAHGIEDYYFFNQFRSVFFVQSPASEICQIELPLYYYNQSNTSSITHTTGATYQRDFTDYCSLQLQLYAQTKAIFAPLSQYPPSDVAFVMSATLQSIAYGLCNLPDPHREILRLWKTSELHEIQCWHKKHHVHNLFLSFLRLRWAGGVKLWFHICEMRPALYSNVYWLGYRRFQQ